MQKYFDSLISAIDGKPIAGASVLVNISGAGTATIYSDNGVTTTTNPLTTEADGSFYFFAANGLYDLVISKSGFTFDADDTAKMLLFDYKDAPTVYLAPVGGTVDAITLIPVPALATYAAGQQFWFISGGANAGAVTVNISGLGVKSVTKNGTTALAAGDIASGELVHIIYDGTRFQMNV